MNADKNTWYALKNKIQESPDSELELLVWQQTKSSPNERDAFVDYVMRGEKRNAPTIAKATDKVFAAVFFDRERLADRNTQFLIPEVRPEIDAFLNAAKRKGPPKNLYLVAQLPTLVYDVRDGAFFNGTNRKEQLGDFRIAEAIKFPRFISSVNEPLTERTAAYPDDVRDRYLVKLYSMRGDQVLAHANSENLSQPQRFGWSFNFRDRSIKAAALALDRVISLDRIEMEPSKAERLLKTTRRRAITGSGWSLVAVLSNARGIDQAYPDVEPVTKGFALAADLSEVLLIAPNGELAERFPANRFPKSADYLAIANSDPATLKTAYPSEVPLTPIALDLLLAKFQPAAIDNELARGMFLSRWFYEQKIKDPLGGRFFNSTALAFTDDEVDSTLPAFKKWLLDAGKRMPGKLLATTEMVEFASETGASVRYSRQGCLFALYTNEKLAGSQVLSLLRSYDRKKQADGDAEPPDLTLNTFGVAPRNADCKGHSSEVRSKRTVSFGYNKLQMPGNGLSALIFLKRPLDVSSLRFEETKSTSSLNLEASIRLTVHNSELFTDKPEVNSVSAPYLRLEASADWAESKPRPAELVDKATRR